MILVYIIVYTQLFSSLLVGRYRMDIDQLIQRCIQTDDVDKIKKYDLIEEILKNKKHIHQVLFFSKGAGNVLKLFLEHKADPNTLDGLKQTPLWIMCDSNRQSSHINLILKHKADACFTYRNGQTLLNLAVGNSCSVDIIRLLLENGAKPSIEQFITRRYMTCNDTFRLLLESGADPDVTVQGTTLLERIVEHIINYKKNDIDTADKEKIIMLLDHGADPRRIAKTSWSYVRHQYLRSYRRPRFAGRMLRPDEKDRIVTLILINRFDDTGAWYWGALSWELLYIIFELLVVRPV